MEQYLWHPAAAGSLKLRCTSSVRSVCKSNVHTFPVQYQMTCVKNDEYCTATLVLSTGGVWAGGVKPARQDVTIGARKLNIAWCKYNAPALSQFQPIRLVYVVDAYVAVAGRPLPGFGASLFVAVGPM